MITSQDSVCRVRLHFLRPDTVAAAPPSTSPFPFCSIFTVVQTVKSVKRWLCLFLSEVTKGHEPSVTPRNKPSEASLCQIHFFISCVIRAPNRVQTLLPGVLLLHTYRATLHCRPDVSNLVCCSKTRLRANVESLHASKNLSTVLKM